MKTNQTDKKVYKKEDTYNTLLHYLADDTHKEGISSKIFAELTGLKSRTTFLHTIEDLEKQGYSFTKTQHGKTVFYKLEKDDSISDFAPITTDIYYEYLLLDIINKHPNGLKFERKATRQDSLNNYYDYLLDHISYLTRIEDTHQNKRIHFTDDSVPFNISKSKLRELLFSLVEKKLITSTLLQDGSFLYLPKTISVNDYSDTEVASLLFQRLNQISSAHRNYDSLKSIREKLSLALFHKDPNIDLSQNYIVYGHQYKSISELEDDLSVLIKANYKTNVIAIIYDVDGITVQHFFSVGLIVYSEISNQLYIMGKIKSSINDEGKYAYIPVSSIHNVIQTTTSNAEYNAKIYHKFFAQMLDISIDEPKKIVAIIHAEFLHSAPKLARLISNRNTNPGISGMAKTINLHSNKSVSDVYEIRYEDYVSDLDSLIPFLRGFGRACKIVEPIDLAHSVKEDIKRTLSAYKEEGFDV